MTEFEIIQEEIESIKQKYLRSAMDIISDHNNENKTKMDYKRRQIYELLQNADDCYSKEIPQISVRTVFDYVIWEIVGTDVDDFKVVCGDDLTSLHICFESDNIHLLIGKSVHQGSNAKGDKKCEYDTDNSDDRS